ncbi:MAG: GAF domain-containing protein [Desulfatirhabdiaceae bacterium]
MTLKQTLKEKLFPSLKHEEDSLAYWRERILFAMLGCGILLSPVVFPPTLIMLVRERLWALVVIDTIVLAAGLYLFFSKRFSYRFRALGSLFLLYCIGAGVLANVGPISGATAWLFGFAVMTGLLLGLRAVCAAIAINLITLIVFGYFILTGHIVFPALAVFNMERGLVILVNFLFTNTVAAMSAAVMVRGLEIISRRQQETVASLHRKIEEHQVSEKALRESEENFRQAEKAAKLNESRLETLLQLYQMTGDHLSEIAEFVMEQAVRLTNSTIGYIAFLNDDETVLTMHAWSTLARKQCRIQDKPIEYAVADTGLWGEAVRQRRPVITNDYPAECPFKKGIPEGHVLIQRHMNVPCFDGNRIVVLAGVGNKQSDYNESDVLQLNLLMIGMWRIIQRKRAEEALRSEKERFRILLQQAPFGMVLVDKTGKFTYANTRFTEIFGYDLNDIPDGRTWFRLAYPDPEYRRKVIGSWKDDLARHGDLQQRPRIFDVVCRDGRKKVIHFMPVRLESGENLVSFEDITGRMALEDQLRHAQKMEAVGTLAGGVAHDFNNLLQGIGGYAQILLMDKTADDPAYTKLKGIENSVERAAKLVRQLLLFSRKAVSERRNLNLGQEVALAVRILERTIPRMIDIEIHSSSRLWTVKADPVQIEQMILNLGVNAADAMPDGGKLILQAENMTIAQNELIQYPDAKPGKYVLITVTDTGIGMDPETVHHIFEPFFTTKVVGKGTGLGLSSVYGIVVSHGGLIQCDSRSGRGTTFRIFFPAIETETADILSAAPDKALTGGTETILIVDDEADIRDLVSQMLGRYGYSVMAAASGEAALQRHAECDARIDLTILDLSMPGMGGFRCLQELLKMNSHAAILIASGYSVDAQITRSLESGAAGFIQKPYQMSELLNRVRDILDKDQPVGQVGR